MIEPMTPVFGEDAVVVVFSSSEEFAPFCCTAILSLIDNVNPKRFYDIIVLDTAMSSRSKNLYRQLVANYINVSIRFYDVSTILEQYSLSAKQHEARTFTVDCFARLLIPDLLSIYNKAIYLDGDQIITDDIANLYDIEISNFCIGACISVGITADLNGYPNAFLGTDYFIDTVYIDEDNLNNIFMSSTLLMNLTKIRNKYSCAQLLEYAHCKKFKILDMDVLNSLFQDDFTSIPQEWGWYAATTEEAVGIRFSYAPDEIYSDYMTAGKAPKIIHFAGANKPWEYPDRIYADKFWCVFRRTPFYKCFVEKQIINNHGTGIDEENLCDQYGELGKEIERLCESYKSFQSQQNRIKRVIPYRILRRIRRLFGKAQIYD